MWQPGWLGDVGKDVRYAARTLRENTLFFVVAVSTLALGIGANTAIFSVANAVLLRTLPVRDAQQLFYLQVKPGQPDGASNTGNGDTSFSNYVFEQLRARHQVFSSLVAYVPAGINKIAVRTGATPEEASVDMVSGDFFSGLGVGMVCGRTLSLTDEQSHSAVAVLGYGFWAAHFGANCSALGRSISVKGVPFTVVGVASPRFAGVEPAPTDVWIPLQSRPGLNAWGSEEASFYAEPNWWCLMLVGRLVPGISPQKAEAMLASPFERAAYEHLGGKPRLGENPSQLTLLPVRGIGQNRAELEKPIFILFAMVALILVIACGNVSLMLAARNAARRREFSIRLAIGGTQLRLFRQLLAESAVLVGLGAALGLLFAILATRSLGAWAGIEMSLAPDARVLSFTLAVASAVALIFSLMPLYAASKIPVGLALKSSSATSFRDKSSSRARRVVLALQIALSLVLIVGAGLFVRSLRNLEHEKLGFNSRGLLVFGLDPQLKTHSDSEAVRFYDALAGKLRSLPGVEGVTLMGNRIGSGWSNNTSAVVDGGDPRRSGASSNVMRWNTVGSGYFGTLGVPIRMGRDFNEGDSYSAPKVVIINETFARRYFKDRQPLGHQVSFSPKIAFTVVGVAANSKYTGVREDEMPMAYFPYSQLKGLGAMHVEVRTAGDADRLLPEVRKTVAGFAPDLALLQPMTQRAQFESSISQEKLVARLSIFFGLLAVLLVATGLYGTLAFSVSRRTAEMGVRMAIGAQRVELLWMILGESLIVCCAGLIIGLPLVLAASRFMASLLYGLAPYDPLTIVLGMSGILAVSFVASLLPASRAASTDPLIALRYE